MFNSFVPNIEIQRTDDLKQGTKDAGVRRVGEYDNGLLLASSFQPLVVSLPVEHVTVQVVVVVVSTEAEEEDAVVDAGAVVLFLGDGVGEGVEGDFDLFFLGEAVRRVGLF